MIPVWVIALVAVLGAVCLALPLHIGMTGICLLLLAAVLLALRILKKKNAPEHWSRLLTGLTAAGMAVIFGAMGYIAVQGQDSIMAQDETPAFIVVLGAQVQGDGPSLTLKKRLDKTLTFMQEHPDKTVIVSGGQGPDEAHTEASVMARYLIEHGADALHGAIRPSKRYLAVDLKGQLHAARGLRLCQGVLAGSARMRLTVQKQERSRYHDR